MHLAIFKFIIRKNKECLVIGITLIRKSFFKLNGFGQTKYDFIILSLFFSFSFLFRLCLFLYIFTWITYENHNHKRMISLFNCLTNKNGGFISIKFQLKKYCFYCNYIAKQTIYMVILYSFIAVSIRTTLFIVYAPLESIFL